MQNGNIAHYCHQTCRGRDLASAALATFHFSSYSSFGGSVDEGDTDQDEDTYGAKKAGVNLGWIATVSNREGWDSLPNMARWCSHNMMLSKQFRCLEIVEISDAIEIMSPKSKVKILE